MAQRLPIRSPTGRYRRRCCRRRYSSIHVCLGGFNHRRASRDYSCQRFAAAVVIGGMDGVFEEVRFFVHYHPSAVVLPFASTDAAAAIIHRNGNYDAEFGCNLTFPSLFRRGLSLT